jgi:hypothetical protein
MDLPDLLMRAATALNESAVGNLKDDDRVKLVVELTLAAKALGGKPGVTVIKVPGGTIEIG